MSENSSENFAPERIQKFLSQAGFSSRRRAEDLIRAGQVAVNGKIAKIGDKVDPSKDKVTVSGQTVRPVAELLYIAVNKPRAYISSRRDPRGRKSVYSLLPENLRTKLWSVGRLDFFSEGLMLFTNDGELTQSLTHPKFGHEKEYEVEVNKDLDKISKNELENKLDKLRHGMEVRGFEYQPAKIKRTGNKIFVTLNEGQKHQVRRMLEAIGFKVKMLRRIRIGKLKIDGIFLGKRKQVSKDEIV